MSVSLVVTWPGGKFEEIPIASLRRARAWSEDARGLGLHLVSHFSSLVPIDRENLQQLEAEVKAFRAAMAARGEGYEERVEVSDRLLDVFERLKQSDGWEASIG